MAILSVQEDFQARKAEGKLKIEGKSASITRVYTRRFLVRTTTRSDGPLVAANAVGIPRPFDLYLTGNDNDPTALCNGVTATPRGQHDTTWDVVATYSTDIPQPDKGGGKGDPAKDPAARPTRYSLGFVTVSRVVETATLINANGGKTPDTPVTNSAGQKFDPTVEKEHYIPVITVTRAENTLDLPTAKGFLGDINSDSFTLAGYPIAPGKARFTALRQTPFFENGQSFWDTTYEFQIDPDGWDKKLLDQGTIEKARNASDGSYFYRVITDKTGNPVNHPVNLDGAGAKLKPDAAPVYRTFRIFGESSFGIYDL